MLGSLDGLNEMSSNVSTACDDLFLLYKILEAYSTRLLLVHPPGRRDD